MANTRSRLAHLKRPSMEAKHHILAGIVQAALLIGQLTQVSAPAPTAPPTSPPQSRQVVRLPTDAEPKLVLPCRVLRVVDGDTLDVVIPIRARVRLLECWAPETHGEEKVLGTFSAVHLNGLAKDKPGVLTVPIKDGNGLADLFSFGRLLGYVSVDGQDLSKAQVKAGHATARKLPQSH